MSQIQKPQLTKWIVISTMGIVVCAGIGLLWYQDTNKTKDAAQSEIVVIPQSDEPIVAPVPVAEQEEQYEAKLARMVDQPTVSQEDMQAFLFETRVPEPYRESHLVLAQQWANNPTDASATIRDYVARITFSK